ncbi:carbohydrate-binding protein with CBM35 doain [Actinomadura pelletieri DSM 43383]|uniref:Carbohydrate-binding protein with CBM35 doain n=1 Tax=Actinomadura pelletieri DSM 43383 TaxID=1120940 RepID=A0A495QZH5_9ACTN|nr:family 43 glycosylhydrolase [Actinomadura pelletieri]RKS79621.1 carbohydrate-binding protein with CBM35 doain [Actinomadura pelletieri DSM 43383]
MRSAVLTLLLVVTMLVTTAVQVGRALAADTVRPAVAIAADFPDPDLLKVGSTVYAYSTSSSAGTVPVASAPSPAGPWTIRGDVLPTKPSWAEKDGGFWAPDVSRRADGQYLLYFTAPRAATTPRRMCVGAALATSPLGPFQPIGDGPLVCDLAEGGDIDPTTFVDTDGKRYLVYKNDGNALGNIPSIIWLQEVRPDGITFIGPRKELLRNNHPAEEGVIEAPVLIRRPTQYVLLYAGGPYCSNDYFTSYAVSPSLTRPFTKAYRPLMTTGTLDGAVQGPGGADVLGDRIFFHGWVGTCGAGGVRWAYTADLGWANDHPVVRGSRVRYEAERGAVNHAVVRTGAVGASQGAVVAKLDYQDSWVDLQVFAPAAGEYTARVAYAAGGGNAQHAVTVNGTSRFVLDYPAHGWDNWKQVMASVNLTRGWNTIRFQHHNRWAELDYIEIA